MLARNAEIERQRNGLALQVQTACLESRKLDHTGCVGGGVEGFQARIADVQGRDIQRQRYRQYGLGARGIALPRALPAALGRGGVPGVELLIVHARGGGSRFFGGSGHAQRESIHGDAVDLQRARKQRQQLHADPGTADFHVRLLFPGQRDARLGEGNAQGGKN